MLTGKRFTKLFLYLIALLICSIACAADSSVSQSAQQSSPAAHSNPACTFKYWEVIPDEIECDVFYLPDFHFRRLPEDPKMDIKLKRFCESFEVRYGITSKMVSYCKDPERDGSGPSFEIDGTLYQADIYFEGCYRGKSTYGKVFINDTWGSAPSYISRIWRMKDKDFKLPDCSKKK